MQKINVSIVIPVYGNNQFLVELSDRIKANLPLLNYEIIFVNDYSPDDSLNTLKILSSKDSQIRYINLPINIGQQKATLKGIQNALGQKIVVLDGDLQDRPELIIELYNKSKLVDDAVFVKRKGIYQSKGRMITSILIKKIIQFTSGLHYKAGSYYIFDRSILKEVISEAANCKHPYMSIIIAHFADKIDYIAADRTKSIGSTGYTMIKRIRAAYMAIYCSLYCRYSKLIPN